MLKGMLARKLLSGLDSQIVKKNPNVFKIYARKKLEEEVLQAKYSLFLNYSL